MKNQEIKNRTYKAKLVALCVAVLMVLAGVVAFLTVTATGRAIVFAIQDPATVNHAASMKAEYIGKFQLTASSPKE